MSQKVASAKRVKAKAKSKSNRATDNRTTTLCSVCKKEVAVIRITVEGTDLLMESCDACDKRRWKLAGKSIDLEDALTEVGEHASRGR